MRHGVGLHVSVVVLAGPDEAAVRLHGLRHHVVDQTVLVPDSLGLEPGLVFPATTGGRGQRGAHSRWQRAGVKGVSLVDVLEDVLEAAVVLLEDGVLGAQVQRPAFGQRHLEGAVRKVSDGLVRVVHPHGHAAGAWADAQKWLQGQRSSTWISSTGRWKATGGVAVTTQCRHCTISFSSIYA